MKEAHQKDGYTGKTRKKERYKGIREPSLLPTYHCIYTEQETQTVPQRANVSEQIYIYTIVDNVSNLFN